jgi:hypothetical protein
MAAVAPGSVIAVTPDEFGARVRSSLTSWKKLASDKRIVVDD